MSTILRKFFVLITVVGLINILPVHTSKAQLFGDSRPMFVEISTDWCHACNILRPTIEQLRLEYGSQVNFVRLNLSNEATRAQASIIAANLGITNFLISNSRAFPTVGILCSSNTRADKLIIGANNKAVYTSALNNLIAHGSCDLLDSQEIADDTDGRPEEAEFEEDYSDGRPEVAESTGRPTKNGSSGRPNELHFWGINETIPLYAYYNRMLFPRCSGDINVICSNNFEPGINIAVNSTGNSGTTTPTFKPPSGTRDEKGFSSGSIAKKSKKNKKRRRRNK